MTKPKSQTNSIKFPVSLYQQERLLKKFANISEVKEELGGLLAKAIATLDYLMENGTPGVQLGAAQTVLQPFIPKAAQVVENLNYDVASLAPEQQAEIIRLGKAYRSILGSASEGRGLAGEATDRISEAQALLLPPPEPVPDQGAGGSDTDESTLLEIEGTTRLWW